MTRLLLALNAGSTSLKFALFAQCAPAKALARGEVHGLNESPTLEVAGQMAKSLDADTGLNGALQAVLSWCKRAELLERIDWVVHRVAHGEHRAGPQQLTETLLAELDELTSYAPLHQPANLEIARKLLRTLPYASHWACFDTAFHSGASRLHTTFAIHPEFFDSGIRKWGYHGLSYAWICRHLLAKHPLVERAVIAHLGGGSSLCGVVDGRSVATTMGMTAVDGVPMSTRAGTLDTGAVLALTRKLGVDAAEYLLYHHSGLLGLSQVSGDPRKLKASDEPNAQFALDHFCLHVAQAAAALSVAIGGLDAMVFTGGIGFNDHRIRGQVTKHLAHLGTFSTFAVRTDEEAEMSLQVLSHPEAKKPSSANA